MCFSDICRHAVLYAVNCICSKLNFFLNIYTSDLTYPPFWPVSSSRLAKKLKAKQISFVIAVESATRKIQKKNKKWVGRESGTCHPPKAPTRYLIKYFPCYMVMQEEEQKEPPERI